MRQVTFGPRVQGLPDSLFYYESVTRAPVNYLHPCLGPVNLFPNFLLPPLPYYFPINTAWLSVTGEPSVLSSISQRYSLCFNVFFSSI